jgi:hypothetical protein
VVRVRRSQADPPGSESIRFQVTALDNPRLSAAHDARFLGPEQ